MPQWFYPEPFQSRAIDRLVVTPRCALFAPPGTAGKTAIILSVLKITRVLNLRRRALVIAPIPVCISTWPDEIHKWYQFRSLDFAVARGPEGAVLGTEALAALDHDITLASPEAAAWLVEHSDRLYLHNTLIVDESTLFKNIGNKRFKYLCRLLPMFSRRHIMTGTPTPNSLLEWFGQQYIVDDGASFGANFTAFRNHWFDATDYKQYHWVPRPETPTALADRAAPFVHTISNTEKIPGLQVIDRFVDLPNDARRMYDDMKRKLVALVEGRSILAASAGVAYGQCRRIAAGAIYPEGAAAGKVTVLHREKSAMLAEVVRGLRGAPAVVFYEYSFEITEARRKLRSEFKGIRIGCINGKVTATQKAKAIAAWQAKQLDILFIQSSTGSLGLNLQGTGRVVIELTPPDSAEKYDQGIRRVLRRGADKRGVLVYRILARDTIEDRVTVPRLESRMSLQDALIQYCKELSEQTGGGIEA